MGQSELGCYKQCSEMNNQQDINMQINKNYRAIDPSYYQFKPDYKKINTSRLNLIKTIPQQYQEVVMKLSANNINFVDTYFQHLDQNIGDEFIGANVKWMRVGQVFENAVIYDNRPLQYEHSVQYTNTKLYSVLTIISQFEEVLKNFISWPLLLEGMYCVILYINGVRQEIIIDDYIPTENGRYLYGSPKDTNGVWMVLAEKALAKVLGNYESINKLSIQEIFEQLTGIPACYSINQEIENQKQLIVLREAGSAYKLSTEIQDSSEDEQDQYINLLRKPNYRISSIEINYSKQYESIYYRFDLPMDSVMSLRISQMNNKIINYPVYRYNHIVFQLAFVAGSKVVKVGEGVTQDNKTYIDSQFIHLRAGEYFMHIGIQTKNRLYKPKCSLVAYSETDVRFKQLLNQTKAEQMKEIMLRSEYQSMLEQAVVSATSQSISTNFVWAKSRGLLVVQNHEKCEKKLKLILLNQDLELEQNRCQRQKMFSLMPKCDIIISFVKGKEVKIYGDQPSYQIRIIS